VPVGIYMITMSVVSIVSLAVLARKSKSAPDPASTADLSMATGA
jgi:hypothetical protein